ncbi:DUF2235 domain-containing protein [Gordonia sp. NPDC003425]
MPKKLIYCADGTWNGPATHTNVSRLYSVLARSQTQLTFYDQGVGRTGGMLRRLTGGAFGDGLIDNVRRGYDRIATSYVPGDTVYLFGFSRGAYTARSLAGMIAYCGLPADAPTSDDVDAAFRAYRRRDGASSWVDRPAGFVDAHIEMIGVWDTVGTLGVPGALFGHQDQQRYGFLDTALHRDVRAGYHALAIDERRRQFQPSLWDSPAPGQIIEQVWFAGVHCDVGGGGMADEPSLSDITLAWMLERADRHRIALTTDATTNRLLLPKSSALAAMRRSWRPYWGPPVTRTIPVGATIANSVAVRMESDPQYRPVRLAALTAPRAVRPHAFDEVVEAA